VLWFRLLVSSNRVSAGLPTLSSGFIVLPAPMVVFDMRKLLLVARRILESGGAAVLESVLRDS
jgi:hypothetical protein